MEDEIKNNDKFEYGGWKIEWNDVDRLRITGPGRQASLICGGDFEYILAALCAVYLEGRMN